MTSIPAYDYLELAQGKPVYRDDGGCLDGRFWRVGDFGMLTYVDPLDTAYRANVAGAPGETQEAEQAAISEPRVADGVPAAGGDAKATFRHSWGW